MKNQKTIWPGGTQLTPVPVVLVGCGDGKNFKYNCLTVAWAGTLSSNPPMVGIGVRPERYSRGLIESSGSRVWMRKRAASMRKAPSSRSR